MVFVIAATLLWIRKQPVILKGNDLEIIFPFIICSIWLLLTRNEFIEFIEIGRYKAPQWIWCDWVAIHSLLLQNVVDLISISFSLPFHFLDNCYCFFMRYCITTYMHYVKIWSEGAPCYRGKCVPILGNRSIQYMDDLLLI